MKKFNVLYLHTHDTGRCIEPYDPGICTPNLMALAQEGVLFRQAFCVGPTCSPSRSGLLTGQYPHENGMYGLAHRGFALNDYEKHLANFLKRNGYETALFGMQHEAHDETVIGYDITFKEPRKSGEDRWLWDIRNGEKAIEYIRKEHKKPFFLSYGLEHTHKPYPDKHGINPDYVKVPACLPDTPETRRDYAGFLASATMGDDCIGKVIQAVKDAGPWDDTIVLYITDHGVALPHMKCTLYDTGTGVAMILSAPGYRNGSVCDALVSQLDFYPTVCDLTGIQKPAWLRGTSMMPLLTGEQSSIRSFVFSEVNYHAARNPQRMIRTERYKYIRQYDNVGHYIPCNIDAGDAKEFLNRNGLMDWEIPDEQLFDLYMDPGERCNLASNPKYADVLMQMREALDKHMHETGDTIGQNGVATVPTMILNRIDCYDADYTDPKYYE